MASTDHELHPFVGHVRHIKSVISNEECQKIIDHLSEMEWYPFPLRKGKNSSRTLCNHHIAKTKVGQTIIEWLSSLFEKFEIKIEVLGMFGNYYPDGEASLPHHSDQYGADVVSLSFGATRLFSFKSCSDNKVQKPSMYLANGDMLIFDQEMNSKYKHGIGVQKQIKNPRFNITCFVRFNGTQGLKIPSSRAYLEDYPEINFPKVFPEKCSMNKVVEDSKDVPDKDT